ncbi:hypothetical protein [Enterobacter cloacae]|uniref:hypothetical protein n=1 Tax=Enterobacter cloacae TaxID=550 RepID=UPI003360E6BE
MDLFKSSRDCEDDMLTSIRRLRLLENAIINYGGGLANLQQRARLQAEKLKVVNPEASKVFADVAYYLRDVAKAGQLDTHDFDTWLREHKFND